MSQVFNVKTKDLASDAEVTLTVTENIDIRTQADAERYVANMPGAIGGTHPGFEVIPAVATTAAGPAATDKKVTAELPHE